MSAQRRRSAGAAEGTELLQALLYSFPLRWTPPCDPASHLVVVLLFMGVGIMDIRVSAEFPCLRQRAAF